MTIDIDNLLDGSANARHLTLGGVGAPTFDADPWGIGQDAMVFDGVRSLAHPGDGFGLPAGDYTWEFRFKRNTANNGTQQVLFGRWAGPGEYGYLCYFDATNKLTFIHAGNVLDGSGTTLASAAIIDGDAHSAAVVKSAGNLSLYIDGTRVAGPTAAGVAGTVSTPFRVGDYDDRAATTGLPYYGTIGNLRFSSSARYTDPTYTVPTTAFVDDGTTEAILPLAELAGNWLGTPVYQGLALERTGHAQASGGWANPDGPLPTLDGKWFFTASAYDGINWTLYAIIADTITQLLAGSGTVQATAIQTPAEDADETDLAANGTVIAFGGAYHHFYHDNSGNVRHSSGATLNEAFPQGTILFAGYDPWVRTVPGDDTTLEMFYVENLPQNRNVLRRTSTDGVTWSAEAELITDMRQNVYYYHPGEPAVTSFTGGHNWMVSDGATAATLAGRQLIRWATRDGTTWMAMGKLLGPDGVYTGTFDGSFYYDEANSRLVVLAAHSENTQPTQPTDSDIGVWYVPIEAPAVVETPAASGDMIRHTYLKHCLTPR